MYGIAEIYVYPMELWDYVHKNVDLIRENNVVIAEEPKSGIEIRVAFQRDDVPHIQVFLNGGSVRSEPIVSEDDAIITCRKIYSVYLGTSFASTLPKHTADDEDGETETETEEEEEEDQEELIENRRIELEDAFTKFLDAVLCEEANMVGDNEFDEMLEEALQMVSDFGFSVYMPTMVNGEFEEYPYDIGKVN